MSYIILTEPFKTCDPPRGNVFYTPAYGCLSPLKYAKRYALATHFKTEYDQGLRH